MKVKICGICSTADAHACVQSGADALGFLCAVPETVPAFIRPAEAFKIIEVLPPFISAVLVTTYSERDAIHRLLSHVPASALQLHGAVEPQTVDWLKSRHPHYRFIKAIPAVPLRAQQEAQRWAPHVDALLLDTKSDGAHGGTGKTHDWGVSRSIVELVSKPVILAGGLSPDNVREAIDVVRPYGVDVNSGVSAEARIKHSGKVRDFIQRAKGAFPKV